jgi:2-dehydropantoate 2-reductase
MEILVYGAGAIGGYLGGVLALAGHGVTMVDRPERAAVLRSGGLIIEQGAQTRRAPIRAVSRLVEAFESTPNFDLIIFGMKAYDVAEAAVRLATICPDPAQVLCIQNGIGIEEIVAGCFGANRTLAGTVTIPISHAGNQHLVVEREGRGLGIAPVKQGRSLETWMEMFREAGVRVGTLPDYRAMKWSKAFLNIMGNATSAILNRPPSELYRMGAVFDLEMRMLQETLAVMRRLGLSITNLPGAPVRPLAQSLTYAPRFLLRTVFTQIIDRGRGDKMPSFHIDLASGKERSEVTFHNGAIAGAGRQSGIPTPVNAALDDILSRLAEGTLERGTYDGRPDRLLAVVGQYEKGEVVV